MKKTNPLMILILTAAVLLAACASTADLNNTYWQLTTLAGQPVLTETAVTLNLEDGALGGSDGCNSYGGSYTVRGNSFIVGTDMFSTMMYCNEPIMTQSNAYYAALNQSSAFKLDGQKLTLLDSSGSVLADFEAKTK